MNDIAAVLQQLQQQRIDQLGHDDADLLQRHRDALGALDKQLAALHGDSAADMIQLQTLTTKRNEAYERLSQMLQKHQQAINTIIGNMR